MNSHSNSLQYTNSEEFLDTGSNVKEFVVQEEEKMQENNSSDNKSSGAPTKRVLKIKGGFTSPKKAEKWANYSTVSVESNGDFRRKTKEKSKKKFKIETSEVTRKESFNEASSFASVTDQTTTSRNQTMQSYFSNSVELSPNKLQQAAFYEEHILDLRRDHHRRRTKQSKRSQKKSN